MSTKKFLVGAFFAVAYLAIPHVAGATSFTGVCVPDGVRIFNELGCVDQLGTLRGERLGSRSGH